MGTAGAWSHIAVFEDWPSLQRQSGNANWRLRNAFVAFRSLAGIACDSFVREVVRIFDAALHSPLGYLPIWKGCLGSSAASRIPKSGYLVCVDYRVFAICGMVFPTVPSSNLCLMFWRKMISSTRMVS